ncbi:MAG TPA: cytochrome c oxidase assembly factor Coa1 family protein [Chthoniobacteraceae bacterium]|nr:cytochrome c oxidase assembly factor Coa1 family protein [Chthoniobacteraceae bacterium]
MAQSPLPQPGSQFPTQPQKKRSGGGCKWLVIGLLLAVVLFGGFVVGIGSLVFGMLKSSDAYKNAVARANADPRVISALGTPVKEGFFVMGNINLNNDSGNADLTIPISGPNGKGTLYVIAIKSAGVWTFSKLDVKIPATGQDIDLNASGDIKSAGPNP